MKTFDLPLFYKRPVISRIKNSRKLNDPRKADYSPTKLDFGPVIFYIAHEWLSTYPMRIEISPTIFLLPLAIIFLVVVFTSLFHTIKATHANPIDHLKNE